MRATILILCLTALLIALSAKAYEEPDFTEIAVVDGVEYRLYDAYLVAETIVTDDVERGQAANIAFRRLFDYISGDNSVSTKIDMTTPVRQAALSGKTALSGKAALSEKEDISAKIAMTTPVRQEARAEGWAVSFVVPNTFDQESAPQPTNPKVYLREIPAERVAVLRYSGRWSSRNINTHRSELLSSLAAAGIEPAGEVVTAFYNAPFTLPPFRRNEVMVSVDSFPAADG